MCTAIKVRNHKEEWTFLVCLKFYSKVYFSLRFLRFKNHFFFFSLNKNKTKLLLVNHSNWHRIKNRFNLFFTSYKCEKIHYSIFTIWNSFFSLLVLLLWLVVPTTFQPIQSAAFFSGSSYPIRMKNLVFV